MTQYSKYNLVYRLQKWMDSVPGQTFLNYAYSWGAAVVILGTMFKLTHLPGANLMIYVGMGVEAVVFFLSAFDRPFDKTADGRTLPVTVDDVEETDTPDVIPTQMSEVEDEVLQPAYNAVPQESIAVPQHSVVTSHNSVATSHNSVAAAQSEFAAGMTEATENYVAELKRLSEVLAKVSEQSEKLAVGSEEMENLNRTLTGICKVYEMQLKSAGTQIATIDQINEQTKTMARQIEQLNQIYARMIDAMTNNMKAGMS